MLTETEAKMEPDKIQLAELEANIKVKEAEMRKKKSEIAIIEDRIAEKNVCKSFILIIYLFRN